MRASSVLIVTAGVAAFPSTGTVTGGQVLNNGVQQQFFGQQPFFGQQQPFFGQQQQFFGQQQNQYLPQQQQQFFNGQFQQPTYPDYTDEDNLQETYTNVDNYLRDRPQYGAPVIGAITGIKMPGLAAHTLAKSFPMAYFPSNAAIHPPADDQHVETFYHTHDHTHLVDWQGNLQDSSYNQGHPFVLPGVAGHPDVVQEHEDAFQHGHIHYHIIKGTDPCRGDDDSDDDDCADTEDLASLLVELQRSNNEAAAAAAAAAAQQQALYQASIQQPIYIPASPLVNPTGIYQTIVTGPELPALDFGLPGLPVDEWVTYN